MYKVSIYVGNKDTAETDSSLNYNYVNIGERVFIKPSNFSLSSGTIFAKNNKIPWVIIYEPIAIAHLKDGKTKLAFTATEYAIEQRDGLFDFFYSGNEAQYIAGMTYINLPNSVVLEKGWFGYTAYSPTKNKAKWNNDRIINGGGWGMRFLRPNGKRTTRSSS